MVLRKRNRSGEYEVWAGQSQGSSYIGASQAQGSQPSTEQKNQETPLFLDPTPPASPVAGASVRPSSNATMPSAGIRSDPSIVFLTTPPRPSPGAKASSTAKKTTRRRLQSAPSLEVIDHRPSKERSRKSLRASPSLIIVNGPTPVSSQPPTKRARCDIPSITSGPPEIQSTPTPSQQPTLPTETTSKYYSLQPPVPFPSSLSSAPSTTRAGPPSIFTPPATQTPPAPLSQRTPSKGKGKRKAADEDQEPKEEKREARFKPKCPQNILDRVERVRQQRLFMIDRERPGKELRETFSVLGSTGNVYTVIIDKVPRCNCPDALKGNHCKHILFIFLKVLRVPDESGHWYQKALLSSELEEIFAQAPLAPNCVVHPHVREAHARATAPFSGPSSQSIKKRWPTKDDDCPICYETMFGVVESGLQFCDACGNAIHAECWKQWQASSLRSGKSVTCVWCRAETNPGGATKGRKPQGVGALSSEGYLNLATVAGLSPVRDTSTYYRGRRRGYGLGYSEDFFEDD